jgi:hypothetical protein
MKKLLVVPFVMLSLLASAQMGELFYGQDWKTLGSFKDSILKALPNYKNRAGTPSKTGKSEQVVFQDDSGKFIKADVLKVTGSPDRISTIQLTGNFEALLLIYSRYFLKAKRPASDHKGNCWPVILVTTSQGQMPVSFCKNISKSDSWTLGNKMPIVKQ